MAIVKGPFVMTGSLSNVSFYTRRGSDKVIMRTKGGAKKEKIKKSPKFEGFRLQQNEWKGCTSFASSLRYALGGLHRLADYNLTPVLNAFAKNIQKTDTEGETGKRSIELSKYRYTLENFNFNRNYPFNTVLRVGVTASIDREKLMASVQFPRINPATDLQNTLNLPYFRLIISLGAVTDMKCNAVSGIYVPAEFNMHGISVTTTGEWLNSENIFPEQRMDVRLGDDSLPYLREEVSLILSVAIEFGKVGFTGEPVEVKYAGCGKILKVG